MQTIEEGTKDTDNFTQSINWVAASSTRNYILKNPLIDWLDLYGTENGFSKDQVDTRTDFAHVLFEQGKNFENAVLKHLETLATVLKIEPNHNNTNKPHTFQETYEAMLDGAEIIFQGTLQDLESKTYGSPDLLFRSDILAKIFPSALSNAAASQAAPGLPGATWHYLIVDVKFITLELRRDGILSHSQNFKASKVQAFICNRALGKLQKYEPSVAFLLGRGWKQKIAGTEHNSSDCMDRLGPIITERQTDEGEELTSLANEAADWMRRLRKDGKTWSVLPKPSMEELRVNAKASQSHWSDAVQKILIQTEDLTTLFRVSVKNRSLANSKGIERWSDPRVNAETIGISGDIQVPRFNALLHINRELSGKPVSPEEILANRSNWHKEPDLEFYVDFEIVNTLNIDLSAFPDVTGTELIFMIGCGHIEAGKWQFESFVANRLTEKSEEIMIDDWFNHMNKIYERINPEEIPQVLHWSNAEVNWLETGSHSARKRHPNQNWPPLKWFDFLEMVVKAEPVAIRGSHNFGLKSVAKALNSLNLINLDWPKGPTDGLGAMVGAWWCDQEAQSRGCTLSDIPLMNEIKAYNEIDCLAMKEIVYYLRKNH